MKNKNIYQSTQAGAAALYVSQYVDARPVDVRQAILDACEPGAVSNVQPNTTTKLLNVVNMVQPIFNITPRAFYNVSEGTIQTSVISLRIKPNNMVFLIPTVADPTIGMYHEYIEIKESCINTIIKCSH